MTNQEKAQKIRAKIQEAQVLASELKKAGFELSFVSHDGGGVWSFSDIRRIDIEQRVKL
jgi:hypothetical protein